MTLNFFALTTRGLEDICAQEISSVMGVTIQQITYRKVTATLNGDIGDLSRLRTVDDLFIHLDTWKQIPPQRSGLDVLRMHAYTLDLRPATDQISQLREIPKSPTFSVTASFVGKRKYSSPEIKLAVADGIIDSAGWKYSSDDHASHLNIRLFIEHDIATVGIRVTQASLQKRQYKQSHTTGSLKPPIAASMIFLANTDRQYPIVDPFCGAGTILIEASQMGYNATGGDIDPEVLESARLNASLASVSAQLHQWDALRLPYAQQSISTVVTNIPWGRQVAAGSEIESFHDLFLKEVERVLIRPGKAVILTNLPEMVNPVNLQIELKKEISLYGQKPYIFVLCKR